LIAPGATAAQDPGAASFSNAAQCRNMPVFASGASAKSRRRDHFFQPLASRPFFTG
jgi:hypothetical protein